jgi:hypothetical protein
MECFDISHQQGSSLVASQVTGAGHRGRSRRSTGGTSLKTVHQERRLRLDARDSHAAVGKRGLKEGDLPQLIVIDGGKGQLAAAHAAMKDVGVEGVDLVALAKSHDLGGGESPTRRQVRSAPSGCSCWAARTRSCCRPPAPSCSRSPACATRRTGSPSPTNASSTRRRGLSSGARLRFLGWEQARRTALLTALRLASRACARRASKSSPRSTAWGPRWPSGMHAYLHAPRAVKATEWTRDDAMREASLDDVDCGS